MQSPPIPIDATLLFGFAQAWPLFVPVFSPARERYLSRGSFSQTVLKLLRRRARVNPWPAEVVRAPSRA
jgi:hypothetical protein